MGRGAGGDGDRLLARLGGDGPGDGDTGRRVGGDPDAGEGWSEGADGQRVGTEPSRPRWRYGGVPPGVAVALLLVAVVAFVLLGRFPSGSGEVMVAGPAPTAASEPSAPVTVAAPEGAAQGAAVAEDLPGTPRDDGPRPDEPSTADAADAADAADVTDVADPGAVLGPVVVHVDGAVSRPGVVRLPPGSRVADAVAAAGGTTEDADTRGVNLARPLVDGEQVVVPRPGELVVAAPAGPDAGQDGTGTGDAGSGAGGAAAGAPGPGPAGPAAGDAGPGAVDLNTADAAELDALPGIGPVLAERIVAWREESGPFVAVEDLTEVSGIGPAVLADVRDLVTV